MSKVESADLILKLYDLRRETKMREARNWIFGFNPTSAEEYMKTMMDPEVGAYLRMVTSYWDMAASFVNNGGRTYNHSSKGRQHGNRSEQRRPTSGTDNVRSNDVSVIDIPARKVIATVAVGRRPYGVALAGGRAFVTDQYAGTVSVFDTATFAVAGKVDVGAYPEGIETSADGRHVLVACCAGRRSPARPSSFRSWHWPGISRPPRFRISTTRWPAHSRPHSWPAMAQSWALFQ